MSKILLIIMLGMILTSMAMTGTLSVDSFSKALQQAKFSNQSNQAVPKLVTTPEEKREIQAMVKFRNDMMSNQNKSKKE
jgi:hypothetical protein